MNDPIERQATISEEKMQIVINNYFKSECNVDTSIRQAFEKGFRIGVKKGLTAQPERKKGRWEMLQISISPPVYKCSVCGNHALQTVTGCLVNRHFEANLTDFCPFCGADMRGKQDEKCR